MGATAHQVGGGVVPVMEGESMWTTRQRTGAFFPANIPMLFAVGRLRFIGFASLFTKNLPPIKGTLCEVLFDLSCHGNNRFSKTPEKASSLTPSL